MIRWLSCLWSIPSSSMRLALPSPKVNYRSPAKHFQKKITCIRVRRLRMQITCEIVFIFFNIIFTIWNCSKLSVPLMGGNTKNVKKIYKNILTFFKIKYGGCKDRSRKPSTMLAIFCYCDIVSTVRYISAFLKGCCCTGRLAPGKRCWLELWPITPSVPSFGRK